MKKSLLITFVLMFVTCSMVCARTTYDNYGKIIKDGTLRGQARAAQQKMEQERQAKAAAAAKIDYEQEANSIEEEQSKSHIYSNPNYKERRGYKGTLR